MIKRRLMLIASLTLLAVCAVQRAPGESNLPPGARVLDPDVIPYVQPYPAISPDGKWVAYVSHGFVCDCNIIKPTPRRILEVPNSWTWDKYETPGADMKSTGDFATVSKATLSRDQYQNLASQVTKTISALNWTSDSTSFVFCVQSSDAAPKLSYDTYLAGTDAKLTKLVHVDSNVLTPMAGCGIQTRDQKFLVSAQLVSYKDYRPLIWSLHDNKPRATPFIFLVPSAKSSRWLGVEKDSRQLVIVNENFDVLKRFEVYQEDPLHSFALIWSPDERFIIWRNQIGFDYYSDWVGFWLNLDTGERRPLAGQYMAEQIGFTGRGGEFFRCGLDGAPSKLISGTVETGAHLTIVSDAKSPPNDLWRITAAKNEREWGWLYSRPGASPVHLSPDGRLFAMVLPRPPSEQGVCWHLIDRDGQKWRFPGETNNENVSPYDVVGFANGGDTIVAYDKQQLFAIPVESIKDSPNKVSK